jgi:cytochrome c2
MRIDRLVPLCGLVIAALVLGPQSATAQKDQASVGKTLFGRRGCSGCHAIGKKGRMAGPDLAGVTQRRSNQWLKEWLKSPDTMVYSDSTAKALFQQYGKVKMPNLKLSDEEVDALIAYLDQAGKASS